MPVTDERLSTDIIDPVEFVKVCWPDIHLYKQQREILYSLRDNYETIVVAGNMLGKDFVTALGVLWFFISRYPCRIMTTSAKETQLRDVLWGDINQFISTSKYPLPITQVKLHLRRMIDGKICNLSYVLGSVAQKGEAMLGHHIAKTGDGVPRTLFVCDEASGVEDENYNVAITWADRILSIGNPFPCRNFFYRGVKEGSRKSELGDGMYRQVIKIKAEDSPNVRYALAQKKRGKTGRDLEKFLVPGVLGYGDYLYRRSQWDPVLQCISLDGDFYEGAEDLLYPPDWLNAAERRAAGLNAKRKGTVMGVDTGMGVANTAWAIADRHGLIELVSRKTPDTAVIIRETLALMKKHGMSPKNVLFDFGGGGKVHVDILRKQGFPVRSVNFGAPASAERQRGRKYIKQRIAEDEVRMVYKNRRAEMYGLLRERLDPANSPVFGLPAEFTELRRQLAVIPLMYDSEGRMLLPPKEAPPRTKVTSHLASGAHEDLLTLRKLLGCSPDEADAVVLAVFGLTERQYRGKVWTMT